jgi:small subunit ribosomal protein S12e
MASLPPAVIEAGLRQINLSGRIAKGFNCTVKAIIKGKAKAVFLADDCDNKDYRALITGLCRKSRVGLQTFPSKRDLARALGLVAVHPDGSIRTQKKNETGCGACALIKYGLVNTPAVEEFRSALDPLLADRPNA